MRKLNWLSILLFFPVWAVAQGTDLSLTPDEQVLVDAIKARNNISAEQVPAAPAVPPPPPTEPMQVPAHLTEQQPDNEIQLSDYAKQQAWQDQDTAPDTQDTEQAAAAETPTDQAAAPKTCLTVAFIDIDAAFNQHPRTQAVKKQIDTKIKSKQQEVQNARDVIAALQAENKILLRQLAEMKPFYERISTDQPYLPHVPETADTLTLTNMLNRLTFSRCEVLSTTPLNTPTRLYHVAQRIAQNKKIIAERSFFIDNYKYQTREEILKLEQEEVKEILQDIYKQIKSFAEKRNIGAIVRKDEVLYGQKPVNVTNDFIHQLKKYKKYRKK